jgi:hypothetical protein
MVGIAFGRTMLFRLHRFNEITKLQGPDSLYKRVDDALLSIPVEWRPYSKAVARNY